MPVSNNIPYIKGCINHTVDILNELKLIETEGMYSDIFKNNNNGNPEDIEQMITIVKYLKTAHHNSLLIVNRIETMLGESEIYIHDNCKHEFIRDHTVCMGPYESSPKICKKCGI
jgi:hypothetical protein